MKNPHKPIYAFAALMLGSFSFMGVAGDHDGHNHSGHDHSDEKKTATVSDDASETFEIPETLREEIDLRTQEIEMREIAGGDEAVIALPKASIVSISGKNYVFAQTEGSETKFERWEVTAGSSDDQFVEAVTGVFPGDKIVSNGSLAVAQIREGTYAAAPEENAPEPVQMRAEEPTRKVAAATSTAPDRSEVRPRNTTCEFAGTGNERTRCDRRVPVRNRHHEHHSRNKIVDEYYDHHYNERHYREVRDCPQRIYRHNHHGW